MSGQDISNNHHAPPASASQEDHSAHASSCHHKDVTHHAHFQDPQDEDDFKAHDSQILVDPMGENSLSVRLGFLQIKHIYEVRFRVPDALGEDVLFDPLENLHTKVDSATPSEDGLGHDMVMTFNATKEKIMKEAVTLRSKTDDAHTLRLVLQARVLGKGKGTPSLKSGIHCVKVEWDEESDASDWQGFN